jgi:hypothetical protein
MTDQKPNAESPRQQAGQSRDEDSIIPGRHGKHGGSEESEGSPQEDAPEAPAPRERDDSNRPSR